MSGNGWCTHPDRQVSSDVRILVRKAELACRNAWGSDLWESASESDAPAAQSTPPADVQLPSQPITVSYDDEVTSVVSADEHEAARGTLDDEVVDQSTISFVDDYDHEQDERRDLLYRDSRSAIERARERARQRYVPQAETPADDDDVVIAEGEDATDTAASIEPPTFEPDDFIEEEAPTATPAVDEHDDALISEGIRTPSPRSRRLRRFRDERNAPKEVAATKIEPEPDVVEAELPPSAAPERGRFDSIPEISADIDLPLLRRTSSATPPAPEPRGQDDQAIESSSYERALKRAHAMNHAARVEQNQQRRRETPPVAAEGSVEAYGMPDLPEVLETPAEPRSTAMPIEVPSGTSATLHPRVSPEKPQPRKMRTAQKSQLSFQGRGHAEREARPSPEARQSWWRGGRKNADHQLSESAAVDEPEPVLEATFDESFAAPEESFDAATIEMAPVAPDVSTFDLRQDEDLESFRARLFASDSTGNTNHLDEAEPPRSPISMARRERRPLVPAARPRREVNHEPVAEAPEEREDRRDAAPPPQRRPRRVPQQAPEVETRVQPEMLFREQPGEWHEPEPPVQFDVRDLINEDTELLDMTIEIAPDVPKVCATCRNYRPSEQAGRGWCTNSWAFTHRQMVNETDIACDSTIGCWWLPADEEVWLEEFEIAADATPRVDRLLARMDPERRAVGN